MPRRTIPKHFQTVILGAGAAGMMCAAYAGGDTLVIDHAKRPGDKIRISGGGRCNFTNLNTTPQNFLSNNKHFAKSALSRYTQHDFVELVRKHNIPFHEKTLGQLFCDNSAKDIITLLINEMESAGATLLLETSLVDMRKTDADFHLVIETAGARQDVTCRNVVIACGGKSIPKMGATGFGYDIAARFDHAVTETRPALVPLTFGEDILKTTKALAGVSTDASVSCGKTAFNEAMLFTHRGLSGPAILQISSYWRETQPIMVNMLPGKNVFDSLKAAKGVNGRQSVLSFLAGWFPKNLAADLAHRIGITGNLADQSDKKLRALADAINHWHIVPVGSEGYRTAEVTLGGVDTKGLNSRTMESTTVEGLYFIGEVVDVTGWLGGYNFQWAWSSGFAAGTAICERL